MPERIDVFISSTSKDLEDERRAAHRAISDLLLTPIGMESFNPSKNDALQVCYDALDTTQIFVGIYAHRYGYIPDEKHQYTTFDGETRYGDGRTGITHMEYQWALERGVKHFYLFVLADVDRDGNPVEWDEAMIDPEPAQSYLKAFIEEIGARHTYAKFDNPDHLATLITRALVKHAYEDSAWRVPQNSIKVPDNFVGRASDISALEQLIADEHYVLLQGIGGTGKTTLAQYLGVQWAGRYPAGVLWASLGPTIDSVPLSVWAAWKETTPQGRSTSVDDVQPDDMRRWLSQAEGRLLVIIDDVWHEAPLQTLLGVLPDMCDVIITSRQTRFRRGGSGMTFALYELKQMKPNDAITLLMSSVGADESHRAGVGEIADKLGYHALALSMAAAYITKKPDHPDRQIERLLRILTKNQGSDSPFKKLDMGDVRDTSLEAALGLSYEPLEKPLKLAFRRLGIVPSGLAVHVALAYALWADDVEDCDDEEEADYLLEELADYGLARASDHDDKVYQQHQNLQAYARALLLTVDDDADDVQARYDAYVLAQLRRAAQAASKSDMRRLVAPTLPYIQAYGNRLIADLQAWLDDHDGGVLLAYAQPTPKAIATDAQVMRLLQAMNALMVAGARRYIFDLRLDADGERWLAAGLWAARAVGDDWLRYQMLRRIGGWYQRRGQRQQEYDYAQARLQLAQAMQDREAQADSHAALVTWYMRSGQKAAAIAQRQLATVLLHALLQEDAPDEDRHQTVDVVNSQYRARLLRELGIQQRRGNQSQEALETLQAALAQERADGNQAGIAMVMKDIVIALRASQRSDEALPYLEESLAIQRALGNAEHIASDLIQYCIACRAMGDYDGAFDALQEARALRINSDDYGQLADIERQFAYYALGKKQPARALAAYERALQYKEKEGDTYGIMNIRRQIATHHGRQQNMDAAIPIFQQVAAYHADNGDIVQQAVTLRYLGNAYATAGSMNVRYYQDAIQTFRQALALFEGADPSSNAAMIWRDWGNVSSKRSQPAARKSAFNHYQRAADEFLAAGDHQGAASTLQIMGDLYARDGEVASAREAYNQAIVYFKAGHYHNGVGRAYHKLGQLMQADAPDDARAYYEMALEWRSAGDAYGLALTHEQCARLAYERHDPTANRHHLRQAFVLFIRSANPPKAATIWRYLQSNYAGDHETLLAILTEAAAGIQAHDTDMRRRLQYVTAAFHHDNGDSPRARDIYVMLLDDAPLTVTRVNNRRQNEGFGAVTRFDILQAIHAVDVHLGALDATDALYQQAAKRDADTGDYNAQAQTLYRLGQTQAHDEREEDALVSYHAALAAYDAAAAAQEPSTNRFGFATNVYAVRAALRDIYFKRGDFDAFWAIYEHELAAQTYDSARVRTYFNMGEAAMRLVFCRYDKAIEAFREARQLFLTGDMSGFSPFNKLTLEKITEHLERALALAEDAAGD